MKYYAFNIIGKRNIGGEAVWTYISEKHPMQALIEIRKSNRDAKGEGKKVNYNCLYVGWSVEISKEEFNQFSEKINVFF